MGKKCRKKSYGFKNLVKVGVVIFNFKITIDRTIFNFPFKTSVSCGAGCSFWVKKWQFFRFFRKCSTSQQMENARKRAIRSDEECAMRAIRNCYHRFHRRLPTHLWRASEASLVIKWINELSEIWVWYFFWNFYMLYRVFTFTEIAI